MPEVVSEIVTEISEDELAGLSEFSLLSENAEQAGVSGPLPDVERVERRSADGRISALRWGAPSLEVPPRIIFLHGGGQNAHTWDTVIVGLGEPALAVDLPGHGHSAWREDGDYSPQHNAETLAPVLHELAPTADLVVGMSLGGIDRAYGWPLPHPTWCPNWSSSTSPPRRCRRHAELTAEQQGTVALMHGEREFPSFQAMLDLTIAAAPHREVKCAAPRRLPQLPPARQRQLDVALRRHPHRPRLRRSVGRRRRVYPHRSPWCAAAHRASSPTRTPPNSQARKAFPHGTRRREFGPLGAERPARALIDILRGVLARS